MIQTKPCYAWIRLRRDCACGAWMRFTEAWVEIGSLHWCNTSEAQSLHDGTWCGRIQCWWLLSTCGWCCSFITSAVEVRLDEPLWTSLPAPQEVAMEMMSYCVQLDCLIMSTMQSVRLLLCWRCRHTLVYGSRLNECSVHLGVPPSCASIFSVCVYNEWIDLEHICVTESMTIWFCFVYVQG